MFCADSGKVGGAVEGVEAPRLPLSSDAVGARDDMPSHDSIPTRKRPKCYGGEQAICPRCGKAFTLRPYCYKRPQKCSRSCPDVAGFWASIDSSGGPQSCWPWLRNKDSRGYGRVRWRSRMGSPHRLAWSLANNAEVPVGAVVMHVCDNPPCCNPAHLRVGTHRDNVLDKFAKGRDNGPRGFSHPFAKMSVDRIAFAARLRGLGFSINNIAFTLSVSQSTVSAALNGRTYTGMV